MSSHDQVSGNSKARRVPPVTARSAQGIIRAAFQADCERFFHIEAWESKPLAAGLESGIATPRQSNSRAVIRLIDHSDRHQCTDRNPNQQRQRKGPLGVVLTLGHTFEECWRESLLPTCLARLLSYPEYPRDFSTEEEEASQEG